MNERTPRGREEDRERIATDQEWEMEYMRNKFHVTDVDIRNAIAAVGNNRKRVEEYLREQHGGDTKQPAGGGSTDSMK